jgi:hypothetical protein
VLRTLTACIASAALGAAITAGVGLGAHAAHAGKPQVKTIGPRDTAIFTGEDLICVNGSALACSSYASPYHGIGMFITRKTVQVTRPPTVKVIASFAR